jgi:hypothetical protein
MKKVIKQDGIKGVFIYDDGTTAPINKESKKLKVVKVEPKKEDEKEDKDED